MNQLTTLKVIKNKLRALEKLKKQKMALGKIESLFPGYLGSQDTYYITFEICTSHTEVLF